MWMRARPTAAGRSRDSSRRMATLANVSGPYLWECSRERKSRNSSARTGTRHLAATKAAFSGVRDASRVLRCQSGCARHESARLVRVAFLGRGCVSSSGLWLGLPTGSSGGGFSDPRPPFSSEEEEKAERRGWGSGLKWAAADAARGRRDKGRRRRMGEGGDGAMVGRGGR